MQELLVFSDGSVNTKSKTGYGAYLYIEAPLLPPIEYKNQVKLKRFENTSSTKLELEILLCALSDIKDYTGKIVVYTDSQNRIGLPERSQKLEQNNYLSAKNKKLNNFELYKQFYSITDKLNCTFIKVKGHQRSFQKDEIDQLFSLVDKASRKALRDDT